MPEHTKMVKSIAHALGWGYAESHTYHEAPLSYEYGDMVTSQEIYRQVEDQIDLKDEDYEWILDDWEEGYFDYWNNHMYDRPPEDYERWMEWQSIPYQD